MSAAPVSAAPVSAAPVTTAPGNTAGPSPGSTLGPERTVGPGNTARPPTRAALPRSDQDLFQQFAPPCTDIHQIDPPRMTEPGIDLAE